MEDYHYEENYYAHYGGNNYERNNGWEEIFQKKAKTLTLDFNADKFLDAGCAIGYLVEALRDLGKDAYGIDVSDYVISQVRDDIKPYCKVQSVLTPLNERYDLITCIEVVEHLKPDELDDAIGNLCSATDIIVFSSSPSDYEEASHYSVHTPAFWCIKFLRHNFYHDINYDCSYISPQAMVFKKGSKNPYEWISEYETRLSELWNENLALRHKNIILTEQKHVLDNDWITHSQQITILSSDLESSKTRINNLILKTNELSEQLERAGLSLKDSEDSLAAFERRHIEVFEQEYIKRTLLEQKLIINKKRIKFLEAELHQANCEIERLTNLKKSFNSQVCEFEIAQKFFFTRQMIKASFYLHNKKKQRDEYHQIKRLHKKDYHYWSLVFNAEDYCNMNPDIKDKIGRDPHALLTHFIQYGMREKRIAKSTFNIFAYEKYNPDVRQKYKDDYIQYYLHYIENGYNEKRRTVE